MVRITFYGQLERKRKYRKLCKNVIKIRMFQHNWCGLGETETDFSYSLNNFSCWPDINIFDFIWYFCLQIKLHITTKQINVLTERCHCGRQLSNERLWRVCSIDQTQTHTHRSTFSVSIMLGMLDVISLMKGRDFHSMKMLQLMANICPSQKKKTLKQKYNQIVFSKNKKNKLFTFWGLICLTIVSHIFYMIWMRNIQLFVMMPFNPNVIHRLICLCGFKKQNMPNHVSFHFAFVALLFRVRLNQNEMT